MFVEIVNDHTNEQVESEKGSEDDEKDKVKVHVNVDLTNWLLTQLKIQKKIILKNSKKSFWGFLGILLLFKTEFFQSSINYDFLYCIKAIKVEKC